MRNATRKLKQFSIMLVDVVFLTISLVVTLWVRNLEFPTLDYVMTHFGYFWILMIFWIVAMYTMNMYSLEKPFDSLNMWIKMSFSGVICALVGFAIFYLFPSRMIAPKTVVLLYGAFSVIFLMIWRTVYSKLFEKIGISRKVIFLGTAPSITELLTAMESFSYLKFEPVAVYDELESNLRTVNDDRILKISTTDKLKEIISEKDVKLFVIPEGKDLPQDIRTLMFSLLADKASFFTLPDFYEIVTRKIPLGSINENWFLRNINLEEKNLYQIFKRFLDIILAFMALVITIAFWPFIALIIKIESPGPVFFKQIREGKGGKTFTIFKFRTMKETNNDYKPTAEKDDRITRFGNFMRKTRIDELPQLLNIINGTMSLIGPRPERPELAKKLEEKIPYYRQRLLVKPGITGWDQVSGEYHSPSYEDTYKKLQYDLYYIKNQSIFLDISIFFKTITTVFHKLGR